MMAGPLVIGTGTYLAPDAHEVAGCDDCCLRFESWCHHPGCDEDASLGDTHVMLFTLEPGQSPDWCPLRKGPLTVQLKGVPCPNGPHGTLDRQDGKGPQQLYCEVCAPKDAP